MTYTEVSFAAEPKQPLTDIYIAVLADKGFDSFIETETGFNAYIPQSDFSDELLADMPVIEGVKSVSFTVQPLPDKNWNEEWEKNFSPIVVGDTCIVKAPFHSGTPKVQYEIIIEPKMSFGTGHHETTWLMLNEILKMNWEEKEVLDMGSGTGVLAILVTKKGAKKVLAVDVDDWAFENAKENIITNNCNLVNVHKGDVNLLAGQKFHVILANINKNVLMNDLTAYFKCLNNGGELLLSGFFVSDNDDLIKKATDIGLLVDSKQSKNNWSLLKFSKPISS